MGSQFSYAAPLRYYDLLSYPWGMPGAWIEDHLLLPSLAVDTDSEPTDALPLPINDSEEHFYNAGNSLTDEEYSLIGQEFSLAEFTEPLAVAAVIPLSPYIVTESSTKAASHVLSREQSPFPMTPTSPISELGSLQADLVDLDGPPPLDDSALSLSEHLAKISAQVMALGDKSLLTYQGMLSRLEHLQAVPSGSIIQNLSDVSDYDSNPFSRLSRTIITDYFCEASDIKSSLLLRQSINLVDIGDILAKLVQKVYLHYEDASVLGRIGREIDSMTEADKQNNFGIQFANLQTYRSRFSPARGESFMEEHCFLISHVEEYLAGKDNYINAASQFLVDPASLMEHRLSHFF